MLLNKVSDSICKNVLVHILQHVLFYLIKSYHFLLLLSWNLLEIKDLRKFLRRFELFTLINSIISSHYQVFVLLIIYFCKVLKLFTDIPVFIFDWVVEENYCIFSTLKNSFLKIFSDNLL